MHSETYILPLSSPSVTFENAGGKGASLARLAGIGQPVPPGFIVVTDAYRRFVTENNLAGVIAAALNGLAAEELEALERASAQIRAAFSAGAIPQAISAALKDAYQQLGAQPGGAAVRSSATTEDLPDLSFAGQQDTFLNILGEAALLKAVVDCWSSLWTGRAIGYRMRSAIAHEQAALAVVVQQMVASEVSGVLFTANPLSGLRSEAVIDAAFGLGEALVSGQVEPDHYVVDAVQGEIRSVTLGSKRVATRPRPGGGVENAAEDNAARQTLSADQARRLAAAGQQIQQAYGAPQDIEWAFAGGELFILQSRPITSLFPIPRVSVDPLLVWFSFGSFQGIVGPLTPLGQEAIQRVVLGIGKKLGLAIKLEEQDVLTVAGERLWVRLDDVLRHPVGGRILSGFLGIGEPGSARLLSQLAPDARLGIGQGRLRWSSMRRALQFTLPALRDIPRTLLQPEKARARFDAQVDAYLQTVQIAGGADRFERLANFAAFVEAQKGLAEALPLLLQRFMPVMAPSLALLNLISHLLPAGEADGPGITMSALDVTRGLPQNVTTEMDLMLWKIAVQIKADATALAAFQSADAPTLAGRYLQGTLPASAQAWMQDFMERYGMRGVARLTSASRAGGRRQRRSCKPCRVICKFRRRPRPICSLPAMCAPPRRPLSAWRLRCASSAAAGLRKKSCAAQRGGCACCSGRAKAPSSAPYAPWGSCAKPCLKSGRNLPPPERSSSATICSSCTSANCNPWRAARRRIGRRSSPPGGRLTGANCAAGRSRACCSATGGCFTMGLGPGRTVPRRSAAARSRRVWSKGRCA